MRWRRTLILSLLLVPVWAAAFAVAEPATQPVPVTQPAVDAGEQMPVIDAAGIQSVVKLSIENKMLRMTTDLPVTRDSALVRIANFPGKTVAVHYPIDNAVDEANIITVRHEMPALPGQTVIYTLSSLSPDDVRLSIDSEDLNDLRSVQFIQMPVAAENPDPEEKPVKLYIQVTDVVNSTRTVDLKLQADNVVELRRKYPRETAEYFQPLLATLGQESVLFAVDHRTAWQVLAPHWTIDPKVNEQVQKIVKDLDADDHATREAASEKLDQLGESAAPAVLRMERGRFSSEQNSRLDAFLAPYRPLADEEARRLAKDVPFLLDCLYSDPAIRDTAIRQLKQVTGKEIDVKTDVLPSAWLTTVRNLRKELLGSTPITRPTTTQQE